MSVNNRGKKILLVDDSNTVLMMERMILNKGPYDLVTARDGQEARESFEQRGVRPVLDLVFLRWTWTVPSPSC